MVQKLGLPTVFSWDKTLDSLLDHCLVKSMDRYSDISWDPKRESKWVTQSDLYSHIQSVLHGLKMQ